jgi:hypothetical protein
MLVVLAVAGGALQEEWALRRPVCRPPGYTWPPFRGGTSPRLLDMVAGDGVVPPHL